MYRPERPPVSLIELKTAYLMALHASTQMKKRVARLGPDQRPAVKEISRYQQLVTRYGQVIEETYALDQRRRQADGATRPQDSDQVEH